jgi:RNA recognition motif-containing protein
VDLPKRLFVGNLSMDVTEGDILKVFGKIGNVASCAWLHHFGGPRRGQPKGFCFVEMKTRAEGQAAIDALNGRRLRGRELRINFAKDEAEPSDDLTKLASSSTASKAAADDHHHRPQVNEATLDRRAAVRMSPAIQFNCFLSAPGRVVSVSFCRERMTDSLSFSFSFSLFLSLSLVSLRWSSKLFLAWVCPSHRGRHRVQPQHPIKVQRHQQKLLQQEGLNRLRFPLPTAVKQAWIGTTTMWSPPF